MVISTRAEFQLLKRSPARAASGAAVARRRRISPPAGHALEILGHAIEYLSDEYIHAGGTFCARDPEVQAIQLLMALNRQIYFECPEVPTLRSRFVSLLHLERPGWR